MPKAILSVHNKTGLVDFANGLIDLGWELIASGGTARYLRENQLPVIEVSNYTGAPEMLGGRVKTLHPAIHAGILARESEEDRNELSSLGWSSIDLVVVNLYPFEETIAQSGVSFKEAIEQIDIGGVALMRAAAKNHLRVTLVSDPLDYPQVLQEMHSGGVKGELRKQLAIKGFRMTSRYDSLIADYLEETETLHLSLYPAAILAVWRESTSICAIICLSNRAGTFGRQDLAGQGALLQQFTGSGCRLESCVEF